MIKSLFCFSLLFLNFISKSQTSSYNNSVLLSATVQSVTPRIILSWPTFTAATSYTVYRKAPSSTSWGAPIATLPGSANSYTDNSVSVSTLYEYNVKRATTFSVTGNGYLLSGIETKLNFNKGILILLIDDYFTPALNTEINQLVADYENDGWFVKKVYANRTDLVTTVKSKIVAAYNIDAVNTKALMLLGHIPVPYSGDYAPDGHVPDHKGAWPSDVYYGDIDGFWSDAVVNDIGASDPRHDNIPGDGKFDDDVLPSPVDLNVGRVDFYNLPAFSKTETQLMKSYLYKLHSFKMRGFIPLDKGIIEDNFIGMAEGFAGSGYTNFSPMFGAANTIDADYKTSLLSNSTLWSYGCGGGSYTSAASIITTTDFVTDSLKGVFTSLFGSYFGDSDSQNNLLRAALANGSILTSSWGGRPYWHYHPMAMGEDIGYCTKLTQNNSGEYFSSTLGCWCGLIQVQQLGDPSLRLHYIAPPSNLIAVNNPVTGAVSLSWSPSSEVVLGYNIYRRDTTVKMWTQLNTSPITTTTYTDNTISSSAVYSYMVRATRMQTTASGMYYNLSLGSKNIVNSTVSVEELNKDLNLVISPNPFNNKLSIVSDKNFQNAYLVVMNVIGEQVYEEYFDANKNNKHEVDLSNLKPGIYIVKINNSSYKIIKE